MYALEPAPGLACQLNQFLRRLRQYRTPGDWVRALLDASSSFADQIAVFAVDDGSLNLLGERNLQLPKTYSFNTSSAAAFAAAIDSKDTVISLRTSREVTHALSVTEASQRAHVIPMANGSRVVAVLFAANHGSTDVNALELIAGMASIVLERQSNASLHAHIALPVRS